MHRITLLAVRDSTDQKEAELSLPAAFQAAFIHLPSRVPINVLNEVLERKWLELATRNAQASP